ncbi:putative membrane-anchored protein [Clostridium beijerinckii]|nr:putative membrane-anchored protein [Clostridium beijerinckii]NOV68958.1 putative membrane-anchored protein [Clostridium beijerinckii]NOW34929.1 putative membrane-anchored protein [Clostridium beijerinckii]
MLKNILRTLAALTIFTIIPVISYANDSINALEINWIEGPKNVDVGTDLAKLDLPSEYVFANGKDAKELMKEMDNSVTGME